MLVAGNGGGDAFFPLAPTLQLPLSLDRLVATVDTLCKLGLYRELFELFAVHLFFPLKAVNADEEVVAVDTLAIEGAYDRRLELGVDWAVYESGIDGDGTS
jgi:hypothetical protein